MLASTLSTKYGFAYVQNEKNKKKTERTIKWKNALVLG